MQKQTHGIDDFFPWSYPPSFLLVAAAVAALPYVPALIVWQGASMLAALAAFRAILPQPHALLFAFGFPGVLVCVGHGQTGFLTAALLAGGVLALPRHEIWAGVLFGLLAYKPQFGLLIPFVLLAGGHWRAIASATATVLATVAVTTAMWGWPVWQAFFDSIPLTQKVVFETGNTGFEKFQSIFAWVGLWGGPLQLSYGLQGIVTLFALASIVWIWRSPVSHRLKGAALLTGVAALLALCAGLRPCGLRPRARFFRGPRHGTRLRRLGKDRDRGGLDHAGRDPRVLPFDLRADRLPGARRDLPADPASGLDRAGRRGSRAPSCGRGFRPVILHISHSCG